jgi:hypothetical protein
MGDSSKVDVKQSVGKDVPKPSDVSYVPVGAAASSALRSMALAEDESEAKIGRLMYDLTTATHSVHAMESVINSQAKTIGALRIQLAAAQKSVMTCCICYVSPRKWLMIPCQHLTCCDNCQPKVQKCPICRAAIQKTLAVFTV